MNPLIKELANRALKQPDADNDGLTVFDNDELTKFAELIVQECMDLADKALQDGKWPGDVLKEHFGVEE